MRVFVFLLSLGYALALPQGYNYQIEVGQTGGNNIQAIPNDYQQILQEQFVGQIPQGFADAGGQFVSNLLQSAQHVIQHEQLQQQQQEQQQLQQQVIVQAPATNVQPPSQEIAANSALIETSQPHFIIRTTAKPVKPIETVVPPTPVQNKVAFHKEFYYLSAPQEEYEAPKDLQEQLATIKKNLKVVFIKAPENNGLEQAALQLAKQSASSQTAIYVLTKQHDASELAQKLNSIQNVAPQRPEVAFIKYRTPEEAEHAQRVIQAQYEQLDGPNHINRPDLGVTHDFVGSTLKLDPRSGAISSATEKVETTKPISKYLPASAKH
ncbi:basic-leucine zipper transcription factor A-like [Musca vetustissima]|uniref:basic-leucine zipper transcription factor A-like n=1 Tax=Musca vetustissima TaxID=27455 RepID=UPI002AB606E6|nr:basic-leucine zipper transcription factor A-like [Musca vetustissima]